jgi:hypothetical protein
MNLLKKAILVRLKKRSGAARLNLFYLSLRTPRLREPSEWLVSSTNFIFCSRNRESGIFSACLSITEN